MVNSNLNADDSCSLTLSYLSVTFNVWVGGKLPARPPKSLNSLVLHFTEITKMPCVVKYHLGWKQL